LTIDRLNFDKVSNSSDLLETPWIGFEMRMIDWVRYISQSDLAMDRSDMLSACEMIFATPVEMDCRRHGRFEWLLERRGLHL
jgi:hypothetical protein